MRIKKKNHICLVCQKSCYCLKYCSKCYTNKIQLGRIPWNKNKKTGLIPKTAFKKGMHFNPTAEFKIGEGKQFFGGEKEYKALHAWIRYHLGSPSIFICKNCKSFKNIEWANKSHKYERNLEDWIPLCKKCHFAYDRRGLVITH